MSSWLRALVRTGPIKSFARLYGRQVERELRGWGLRWDDMTSEGNKDYTAALRLLPYEIHQARGRRLDRCVDMSAKHLHLEGAAYHAQEPWRPYISPIVDDLEKRRYEQETYR